MKVKFFIVLLFLTIPNFADHSESYKIEIKPAEVIDTIIPLTIDVYTDYNSGEMYELQRQIVYPLTHKKYIVEKKEGGIDSLIEIKKKFWCEYPEVKLPYDEYFRIKTKKVEYSYFKNQPAYPTVTEHVIIENDTIRVVASDPSLSIAVDADLNARENKDSIEPDKNSSEQKEKSISEEKKQQSKSILQRIKDFFSR